MPKKKKKGREEKWHLSAYMKDEKELEVQRAREIVFSLNPAEVKAWGEKFVYDRK